MGEYIAGPILRMSHFIRKLLAGKRDDILFGSVSLNHIGEIGQINDAVVEVHSRQKNFSPSLTSNIK